MTDKRTDKEQKKKVYRVFSYDGSTRWGREPESEKSSKEEAEAVQRFLTARREPGSNRQFRVEEVEG